MNIIYKILLRASDALGFVGWCLIVPGALVMEGADWLHDKTLNARSKRRAKEIARANPDFVRATEIE